MGWERLKLLLLLIATALTVYVEAAPGVVEPPNQPPKNETPAETVKDDSTRVNLIFPRVESIDKVECAETNASQEVFVNCTIDFRTRLVKYQIRNYDFTHHTGELVKVDTVHKNPAQSKGWVYINGQEFTFREMEQKATDWLSKNHGGLLWNRKDMPDFIICDAYSKFNVGELEYDFCIHDTTINIRNSKSTILFISAPSLDLGNLHDYFAPVTSAYVYKAYMDGGKLVFHLFWTDAVGRMKISKLIAHKYKIEAETEPAENKYLELSVIPNPITKNFIVTWPKGADYMSKKPHLVEKFKADLEKKWRSDFIMAASPIYMSFNTTTNNSTNQSKAEPKVDSIGLCFVRGYRMFETTENGLVTNFDCRKDGVSQSEFVELPKLQSPFLLVTHAYHVANVDGYRFIHLFYSLKHHEQTQNRYVFCKQKSPYASGQKIPSDALSHLVTAPLTTNPAANEEVYCKLFGDAEKDRLHVSPSDIFAYYDGKVVKTITLWGLLYTVSDHDKPIETGLRDTAPKPKMLENVEFRINAAFSTGQTVYIFTHNNIIIIAPMKMDADYKKLTIDFNSAEYVHSETFIYNNFLRPKGDTHALDVPYIEGFYEYQKDADDTYPPSGAKLGEGSGGNGTEPDDGKPDGKSDSKKPSTIWLIVLIIIIAALILAALAYLFFIRGGDEQVVVGPKSAQKSARKSVRKSPLPGLDMESNIKTVRSQQHSSIGGAKSIANMTKSPSHKSAIKSPGRKSAIAKSPSQKSSTKSPSQKSDTKSPSKKSTIKSPVKSIIKSPAQASGTKSSKKSKRKSERSPTAKSVRKSQKSPAKSPTGKTIEKTITKKN